MQLGFVPLQERESLSKLTGSEVLACKLYRCIVALVVEPERSGKCLHGMCRTP